VRSKAAGGDLSALFATEHSNAWQTKAGWLALAAAIAYFVWAMASAFWQFLAPPPDPLSSAPEPVARVAPTIQAVPIAQFHLFGQTADAQSPATQAPATQLKLTLVGVAAGRDSKSGVAIIADERGQQRQYQSGDVVAGAILQDIYSDRVLLMYQGRLETLMLPRLSQAIAGSQNAANDVTPAVPQVATPLGIPRADPSNGYVNLTGLASNASFAAAREQALANPAGLIGMVEPVLDANGQLSGVRLNGGANQALLTQAGILPNDVVVAVNGRRIDSFAQGGDIARQLADAEQVSVTVRRDGREITLPSVRLR
jgi:general secretion pathway protein C